MESWARTRLFAMYSLPILAVACAGVKRDETWSGRPHPLTPSPTRRGGTMLATGLAPLPCEGMEERSAKSYVRRLASFQLLS
jgi:hypothetical protein